MIFDIEFEYFVRYRHYRARKVRMATVLASVTVDIEVVPDPGEPVFTIDQPILREYKEYVWQRFRRIGTRAGRVWRIGDTLYSEYCPMAEFTDRVRGPYDNPFNACERNLNARPFGPSPTWRPRSQWDSFESISKVKPLKLWEDDGGDEKAELISRRACAMRVIDDVICVAVGEPLICVEETFYGYAVTAKEGVPHQHDGLIVSDEHCRGRLYRVEHVDSAKAFAAAGAKTLRADLFCTGVSSPHLAQEGQHVRWSLSRLSEFMSGGLRNFAEAEGEAWQRFHRDSDPCPGDHVTTEFVTAADLFLGVLSNTTMWSPLNKLDELVGVALEDIRIWRDRAIDPADWSYNALPQLDNATRWFEPILSPKQLEEISVDIRIPFGRLLEEHEQGNRLFLHRYNDPHVVVISPDLTISKILGPYGKQVSADTLIGVQDFLTQHRDRELDIAALGELMPSLPDASTTVSSLPASAD